MDSKIYLRGIGAQLFERLWVVSFTTEVMKLLSDILARTKGKKLPLGVFLLLVDSQA